MCFEQNLKKKISGFFTLKFSAFGGEFFYNLNRCVFVMHLAFRLFYKVDK